MQKYFLKYCINNKVFSIQKLLLLRKLSKSFKNIIESNDEINKIIEYKKMIQAKLFYDKNIYDQYSYLRITIKNNLKDKYKNYKSIQIPYINNCQDDFESDKLIYFVDKMSISIEFIIFVYEYIQNPAIYINLISYENINSINILHEKEIRNYITNNYEPYGLILFLPLIYIKTENHNEKSIKVLCYVNVIDQEIENSFPDESERYIVFTIETKDNDAFDVIKKYIESITKSLISNNQEDKNIDYCYPQDIEKMVQPLEKAINLII